MFLDLSEIVMRDGMRVGLDVDQPSVEDPDLAFSQPLKGRLVFSNQGDVINVDGEFTTTVRTACSRCLEDAEVPLTIPVDEHWPVDDVQHPNRPPDEGAELETVIGSIVHLDQGRPILDLDELMRQLIVAEMPIRVLCEEECQGLCPTCGANLNEEECRCEDVPQNTPLAALGALLKNGSG